MRSVLVDLALPETGPDMSKLTKLLRHPNQFVADSWPVRRLVASVVLRHVERELQQRGAQKAAAAQRAAKAAVDEAPAAPAVRDQAAARKPPASKPAAEAKAVAEMAAAEDPPKRVAAGKAPSPERAAATASLAMPAWFRPEIGADLQARLSRPGNHFLYLPWVAQHGDALIERISLGEAYSIAPLDIFQGVDDHATRQTISRFARERPELYRRMLLRRLIPLKPRLRGFIFTFDWHPVMRELALACGTLGIPRILVPHESVFMNEDKYYVDIHSGVDRPVADLVLGWGALQGRIFLGRGLPAASFIAVGAPKFDRHVAYRPDLDRASFFELLGLDPERRTILFAAQPMDSQTADEAAAREAQRRAIADLLAYGEAQGVQVIVRTPPSKQNVVGNPLLQRLSETPLFAVDSAHCYLVAPEEAIHHADVVVSVNSTMLFEALLMGRPAVSAKYLEFEQIWAQAGIPAATGAQELAALLDDALAGRGAALCGDARAWAANNLSCGAFDGRSAERVAEVLTGLCQAEPAALLRHESAYDVVREPGTALGTIAVAHLSNLERTERYLPRLLNARRVVSPKTLSEAAGADLFVQWGITPTKRKAALDAMRRQLGRPRLIVEDGFLRSTEIGLSGAPALSIILDDITAYYDASRESRLQKLMESDQLVAPEQLAECWRIIERIVSRKVSKYNHAPIIDLAIGAPGRDKVLVVDQRYGDQSVASSLADEDSFRRMLLDAIKDNPDCDVIIKQHPDALTGGKQSYFAPEAIRFIKYVPNVHVVDFDVNPWCLLGLVRAVYVVSSGMGFEALMAGKKVHCYGVPFYANRGVTLDRVHVAHRTRQRSVAEIFYFAYMLLSRYYDPRTDRACGIEDVIDYLVAQRR